MDYILYLLIKIYKVGIIVNNNTEKIRIIIKYIIEINNTIVYTTTNSYNPILNYKYFLYFVDTINSFKKTYNPISSPGPPGINVTRPPLYG